MKNLLTFLLLVISLSVFGQSDSQSLEVEIKYWKSIAESNDTAAYREYLQRYGEDGLYKDEALARIALLKTSGKQVQTKNTDCCFYRIPYEGNYSVVRFESGQNKVWLKRTNYDPIRNNLAISSDFYESQATIALTRGTQEYKDAIRNGKEAIEGAEYARKYERNRRKKAKALQKAEQAKSPDYYKNAWTKDEEYQYDPMKSTSSRDVYFKRDILHQLNHDKGTYFYHRNTLYLYSDDQFYDEYRYYDGYYYDTNYYNNRYSNSRDSARSIYKKTKSMQGYRYIAFSKDKSSFIMWFEEDNNLDGKILEKREYKLVPKEDLLPKAVNYDFLNR